jgi:hypothetical protein
MNANQTTTEASQATSPIASTRSGCSRSEDHHNRASVHRTVEPAPSMKNNLRLFSWLLTCLACGAAGRLGAGPMEDWSKMSAIVPQGYVCYHASGPVKIDGQLDEAAWQAVPWTADFADIEGAIKPKPRFRTRAKMLWDDDCFYVAAELEEPHVWGTLTQHDTVIFNDHDFEVFMDPDGDSHEYYEFEINALNTGWDLRLKKPYKDGGPALNEWEIPGLKTAVHVNGTLNKSSDTDVGWTLEIAFPWKALAEFTGRKTPPAEGDQWRVGFSRVEWLMDIIDGQYRKRPGTKEDNWVWSPQGIVDMHRPEKWGYVQFSRKPIGSVAFAPDPAAAAKNQLHQIYYAQRAYQEKNGGWAVSLGDLSLNAAAKSPALPSLKITPDGFEVTVAVQLTNGKTQRCHIRQDARVWSD